MGFALKASPSRSCALRLSRPAVGAAVAAVPPKRLVLRAVTAAAVGSLDPPGRRMVPTTPRIPAALLVPVASRRSLSVAQTLSRIKEQGKTAFIPYITAGDPDLATTAEALRLLDACGADVIELGMPFSDPCADGPVIRASAARALAGGASVDLVLSMLKEVTRELSCPVVILSYFNPIAHRGTGSFTAAAKDAGVRGLIVPDLSYAETSGLKNEAVKNDIELVLLTTPSTKSERMKEITVASEGFVYLVSINGVTGTRLDVSPHVKDLLKEIKQVTNKAVAVGFGISTPDHVRQVAQWGADGVIIGSAMVKQLGEADSPREGLKSIRFLYRRHSSLSMKERSHQQKIIADEIQQLRFRSDGLLEHPSASLLPDFVKNMIVWKKNRSF